MATYTRSNFLSLQLNSDLTVSIDPITDKFTGLIDYLKDKQVKVITITDANIGAPDLISYKEYGTHDLWWIILLINRIQDPINELVPGIKIAVPFKQDIDSFIQLKEEKKTVSSSVSLL